MKYVCFIALDKQQWEERWLKETDFPRIKHMLLTKQEPDLSIQKIFKTTNSDACLCVNIDDYVKENDH